MVCLFNYSFTLWIFLLIVQANVFLYQSLLIQISSSYIFKKYEFSSLFIADIAFHLPYCCNSRNVERSSWIYSQSALIITILNNVISFANFSTMLITLLHSTSVVYKLKKNIGSSTSPCQTSVLFCCLFNCLIYLCSLFSV